MPRLLDLTRPVRDLLLEWNLRWRMRDRLEDVSPEAGLVPLTLSSAFGERLTSAEILRLGRRCVISRARIVQDQKDLARGAGAHVLRNVEPLLELKRRGIGVVVCSIHLGPYFYVARELAALGFDLLVYSAEDVRDHFSATWEKVAREMGSRFETLPSRGPQSLIRALRGLKQGWNTVIYVDSRSGVGGPAGGRHHTVEVPLMSLTVRLRMGPAFLAQRARVPLVLAAARRGPGGRREVEFSEPLPPPAGEGHEERVACMLEMARWFDARVRRDPDQWNAWFLPLLAWSRSGAAPTATREELERTRARVERLLAGTGARAAVLRADPARVAPFDVAGCRALIHGPTRRILEASPLASDLLRAALRGVPMRRLPRLFPVERSDLVHEVTRMVLADLATIENGNGA